MNYQQVLSISYVFHIMNILLNPAGMNETNHKKIVKREETFYIQDYKNNLYLIQENMGRSSHNVEILLNTFILFEENKNNPLDVFINSRNHLMKPNFDNQLLDQLMIQYATDKTYFNRYSTSVPLAPGV